MFLAFYPLDKIWNIPYNSWVRNPDPFGVVTKESSIMSHLLFTNRATTASQLAYHLDRCVYTSCLYPEFKPNLFRSDRNAAVYFIERAMREIGWVPDHMVTRYEQIVEQLQGETKLEKTSRADIFKLARAYWDEKEGEEAAQAEPSWEPEDAEQ